MPFVLPVLGVVMTVVAGVTFYVIVHSLWVGACLALHAAELRHRGAPRPPVRAYLRVFVAEWWATLAVISSYLLGVCSRPVPTTFDPEGGPPVLLVHGFMMNRSSWFVTDRWLEGRGYHNRHAVNLRPMWGSIRTIAQRLIPELDAMVAAARGKPLVVVAHSMGGIVMRWILAERPDLPIELLVTIATPHRGTVAASLHPSSNAAEMRVGSKFLASLPTELPCRTAGVYAPIDQIVVPSSSAVWGDMQLPMPDSGHMAVLFSTRMLEVLAPLFPLRPGALTGRRRP